MTRTIVGIDGSASSVAALRWAVDAARPGDEIVAVMAWSIYPVGGLEAPGINPAEVEVATRRDLADVLAPVEAPEGVTITSSVVHGRPAGVLTTASRDADLVVVGRRGLGGFLGLVLGSVSDQVVHHARCPVVVVSAPDDDA